MSKRVNSRAASQADRLVSGLPEHGLAVLNRKYAVVGWNAELPAMLGIDATQLALNPPLMNLIDDDHLYHPLEELLIGRRTVTEYQRPAHPVIALRSEQLPDGGCVVFFYILEPHHHADHRADLERLLEGLERIEQGFALFDTEDRLVLSNTVFDRLIAGDAKTLPGRNFQELMSLFAIAQFRFSAHEERENWVQERVKNHQAPEGQEDFQLADGRYVRLREIHTQDGGTVTLLGDITEQRRYRLREAEAERSSLLQNTLNSLEDGIAVFDAQAQLNVWNSRWADMMQVPAELAVIGTPLKTLITHHAHVGIYGPGNPDEIVADRLSIIEEHEEYIYERRRADGTTIRIKGAPTPDGGYIVIFTDISVAREHEDKVTYLATHDTLTALPNRNVFTNRLDAALKSRGRRQVALLFLDLLNFKDVNATLGHDFGDMILRATARRVKNAALGRPFIARFGGDKFAIMLESLDGREKARELAEGLLKAFDHPILVEGHELHLSLSIGIAFAPDDAKTGEQLISRAELALFAAKADQGNDIREFHPRLTAAAEARRELQQDLRRALKLNELELHFQPKINAVTEQITGLEALIRWHHPQRGYIPPTEFIPIAERTGLILPIGEWVLEQACQAYHKLKADGFGAIDIAVNLSATQLHHTGLLQSVRRVLRDTDMNPTHLELEITESTAMRDAEHTRAALGALAGLGLKLTIDDFGTGYSSLSYLKRFPVSKIKIDRSFVQGVCHDVDDEAIVNAVIQLASSLGLKVVAEAVETEEQLNYLIAHDCPEIQGFYFSPALPYKQLTQFIRRWVDRTGQQTPNHRLIPAE